MESASPVYHQTMGADLMVDWHLDTQLCYHSVQRSTVLHANLTMNVTAPVNRVEILTRDDSWDLGGYPPAQFRMKIHRSGFQSSSTRLKHIFSSGQKFGIKCSARPDMNTDTKKTHGLQEGRAGHERLARSRNLRRSMDG